MRKLTAVSCAKSSLLLFTGPALAEDPTDTESSAAELASYNEPAQIDREAVINELVAQWGSDDITAYQLRAMLEHASDSELSTVLDADSLEAIVTILRGDTAPLDVDGILSLGSTMQDFTFTPVTPCRIVDTRKAGGIMPANSTREFYVYGGGGLMTPQGGNAAGCTSPVGEPRGVMINVTAVPSGNGNLKAYPANVSTPTSSLVNYRAGVNIANAAGVKTYFSGGKELEISSTALSHVVIDVLGYYSQPGKTLPNQVTVSKSSTVGGGLNKTMWSPNCPAGYRLSGGGHAWGSFNVNTTATSHPEAIGTNLANRWLCQGTNLLGTDQSFKCEAVCIRVPGR